MGSTSTFIYTSLLAIILCQVSTTLSNENRVRRIKFNSSVVSDTVELPTNENGDVLMSTIVIKLIELVQALQDFEAKVHEAVSKDPYLFLIENKLRPLIDEYEEIADNFDPYFSSPGSNTAEIMQMFDKIEQMHIKIPETESEYRRIAYQSVEDINDITELFEEMFKTGLVTIFFHFAPKLRLANIKLPPLTESGRPPQYTGKVTLDDSLEVLKHLTEQLKEYEKLLGSVEDPFPDSWVDENSHQLESVGPVLCGTFYYLEKNITQLTNLYDDQKQLYEMKMRKLSHDLFQVEKKFDKVTGKNIFNTAERELIVNAKAVKNVLDELIDGRDEL